MSKWVHDGRVWKKLEHDDVALEEARFEQTRAGGTRGPWHLNWQLGEIQGPQNERVGYINVMMNPHDAALMALAPELLAALERIDSVNTNPMHVQDKMRGPLEQARAALAKARGES